MPKPSCSYFKFADSRRTLFTFVTQLNNFVREGCFNVDIMV